MTTIGLLSALGLAFAATSSDPNGLSPTARPSQSDPGDSNFDGSKASASLVHSPRRLRGPTSLQTSYGSFGAVGDGIVDDTAAIQAAYASGKRLYCDDGAVFRISATIELTTTANHGQVTAGGGAKSAGGIGSACVIRPASTVSVAFRIDGAPFDGYVQGFGFEGLTIDMADMADSSRSIAFDQERAFDGFYTNVRVNHSGVNKLSWRFGPGAYATLLSNVQGGLVSLQGASSADEVTTITLVNPDIVGIVGRYANSISLVGGAIQRGSSSSVVVIYLPPGTTPVGFTANTRGLYAGVLSQVGDTEGFTATGTDFEYRGAVTPTKGCSAGQYNDGAHGCLSFVPVIEVASTAKNTAFVNAPFSGVYLLDLSSSTTTVGGNAGGGATLDRFNVLTWFSQPVWFTNGASQIGFSDGGARQTYTLDAATGLMTFYHAGSTTATIAGASGKAVFSGGIDSTPVGATAPSAGSFTGISAASFTSRDRVGVTCSGPPTARFAVTSGIVTHC